jgi:hypothetical protein
LDDVASSLRKWQEISSSGSPNRRSARFNRTPIDDPVKTVDQTATVHRLLLRDCDILDNIHFSLLLKQRDNSKATLSESFNIKAQTTAC